MPPTDLLSLPPPLSLCVSPSSFSLLTVSLDNNNLPHWAHYSIKEGLHENTDHCVGSGALSFDSLSHPHEKKTAEENKKENQFRDNSLTGNLLSLNLVNIQQKGPQRKFVQSESAAVFDGCLCSGPLSLRNIVLYSLCAVITVSTIPRGQFYSNNKLMIGRDICRRLIDRIQV